MVRVLQVIGSLNTGGSQAMIMNLYRSIDRSKVQFDFVIFHDDERMHEEEITKLGGIVYYIPAFNGKNIFNFVRNWKNFLTEHPEYRIVHGHVRSVAAIYLFIAKKMGRVTIAHSHSTSNGEGFAASIKDIMQLPIRYIADYLFACSDDAGQYLYGKYRKFEILQNSIECEKFSYNPLIRKKIRIQLGIEDAIVIGHVGRFVETKNQEFLVDLFYELQKKDRRYRLLFIGDGVLKEKIVNKCKNLEILSKVIFLGNKTNTQDYYQAMDVFILPSLFEGLGIAAVEAQAAGLPCILSEGIPKCVELTSNVAYLSLLDEKERWIDKINNFAQEEREISNAVEQIKKAGYDVKVQASKIQKFYLDV